ncbi:hypothetical protein [Rurimicrobium arvi]|uniref:FlgD Ig-like domain-containing protein n=1 Tax=Rurimicrobium arvi TaxID=2049916 RepID=A0ABP8MN31_9BACT
MKKLLLLGCGTFLLSAAARAQSAVPNPNLQAQERMDARQEHFIFPVNANHSYNVVFLMYPRTLTNEANVILQTNDPFLFHATVTDETGRQVHSWKPDQPNTRFYAHWDLSKYRPGNYTVHVFKAGKQDELYRFEFAKQ